LSTVLLITKLGDIGAYIVGMRFGKTPLIPRISPKKSVEGSIGGLLFSISGALVSKAFLHFSYLHLISMGIFLGILGQLGDLSESLIKRDCEVKDSGNIFPGLGGVLDAIDSLLFTAPAFYFYISNVLK
jgi:phosphatidate cytidylyltransferase